MIGLPEEFKNRIKTQFPNEEGLFISALDQSSTAGILINQKKLSQPEGLPVGWNPYGKILLDRPTFTSDPHYHAGAYYAQEINSMFIHELIRYAIPGSQPITALDLCAAPGGKSLLLNSTIHHESICISNEITPSRLAILRENLGKWGALNQLSIGENPRNIPFNEQFNLILVDAPCSGEGLFRKHPSFREEWCASHALTCSMRQKEILLEAIRLLKPNGFLIYSTCTYAPEENEQILDWLVSEQKLSNLKIPIDPAWQIHLTNSSGGVGYQFLPHKTPGEGFFCALFQKQEETHRPTNSKNKKQLSLPLNAHQKKEVFNWAQNSVEFRIDSNGRVFTFPFQHVFHSIFEQAYPSANIGVQIGHFIRDQFIPHQYLVNTQLFNNNVPKINLSYNEAHAFLRGESLEAKESKGYWIASYENQGLGWLKSVGNRSNNNYPKPWLVKQHYSI